MCITIAATTTQALFYNNMHAHVLPIYTYVYIYIPLYMQRHRRSSRAICMRTCYQYICMCMYTNIPIHLRRHRCTDTYSTPNDTLLTPKETYLTPKDTHVTPKVYVYIYTNTYATKQALRNILNTKRDLSYTIRHPCYTTRDPSYSKSNPSSYTKRDPSNTILIYMRRNRRSET